MENEEILEESKATTEAEKERRVTTDGSGITITKKSSGVGRLLLLILAGIIGFPILVTVFGVLFGLGMAALGVLLGFGIGGVSCVLSGGFVFFFAIAKLMTVPVTGLALFAAALVLAGVGCLLLVLAVLLGKVAILCLRGITGYFGRKFQGKQVA